jgi:uncharacterized protein (TIGR02266 family)
MSDGKDKREHPRVEIILKVEYSTSGDFLADYAYNASGGGLFIATTRPFSVGETLVCDIAFPGLLSPIRCHGEVRWRRPPEAEGDEKPAGIGVAFIFKSDEEREQVQQLVKSITQTSSDRPPEPESMPPFRVLLAEDNPMVREMFCFAVRKFHRAKMKTERDLEVIEAENGSQAWDRIAEEPFDMAIIDYYMPVMDGGQLIRKIRGDDKIRALPIIVVSVGGDEARKGAYDAGADLFLDKPVLLGQLFDSLKRLLGLEQQQDPAPKGGE